MAHIFSLARARAAALTLTSIILFLWALPAAAQVSIRADVNPPSGALGDIFVFTITLEGTQRSSPPLLSGGEHFDLELLGPQTSVSIINGRVSTRISYVYRLTPKVDGELLTPSAEVEVNGEKLTADSITVPVSKSPVADVQAPSPGDRLFLRQSALPDSVYQGQQVVNAVTVFTRVELREPQLEDLTTDGFWQETIVEDERSSKHVNGYNYTTVEVRKALFPLRSGNIALPSRKLTAKVRDSQRRKGFSEFDPFQDDFFEQFFGVGPLQEVTATSNDARIEVKPLPSAPPDLQPLLGTVPIVGPTKVKIDYSPDVINVGESKTVTVEVISEGNLNPLKTLAISPPAGMKMYEERPDTKVDTRGARLVMHKRFRYSFVPLKPGLFRFQGVRLAYFDPDSATYKTASSEDVAFAVQGKAIQNDPDPTAAAASNLQSPPPSNPRMQAIPTLPPIPIGPPLRYEEPTLFEEVSRAVSVQMSLLILAAAFGLWTLAIVGGRWKRPAAVFVKPEEVRRATDLKELEGLLRRMISAKLAVPPDSSLDQLRAATSREIKDKDTALAVQALLDDFEVLRYGKPGSVDEREIEALKTRTLSILTRL